MDRVFWADGSFSRTYSQLFNEVEAVQAINTIIYEKEAYQIFVRIVHSLVYDYPITILDSDFSESELSKSEYNDMEGSSKINHRNTDIATIDFGEQSKELQNWRMTLFTSGTTGIPKKITHTFASITKSVKMSLNHKNDVWGFAYNPTHMAGTQVFFQAFLNRNPIINVFNKSHDEIYSAIRTYKITHLSATPTFYRLLLKKGIHFESVKQVSSGGEKFEESLKQKLSDFFPNASVKNIYASTEAGSLFAAIGDAFRIPEKLKKFIKIQANEILIHESILGTSDGFKIIDGWYYSGDIVEIIEEHPEIKFRFLHRKNEMINVGGYKVNPQEVESEILKIQSVSGVRVFGKKNSVLGNILCAEVVSENVSEKDIKIHLSSILQPYKIPRIIDFVEQLEITRTGKLKR
jgi:acyl-coenzyme A synthetase/AMP-(fatty) acid ligase